MTRLRQTAAERKAEAGAGRQACDRAGHLWGQVGITYSTDAGSGKWGVVIVTWKCHRRGCGGIRDVTFKIRQPSSKHPPTGYTLPLMRGRRREEEPDIPVGPFPDLEEMAQAAAEDAADGVAHPRADLPF